MAEAMEIGAERVAKHIAKDLQPPAVRLHVHNAPSAPVLVKPPRAARRGGRTCSALRRWSKWKRSKSVAKISDSKSSAALGRTVKSRLRHARASAWKAAE
jgi:hypothetical protein